MPDPPNMRTAGPDSGLSKKIGGLPTWGWIALAAAGGIGFFMWRQNRAASTVSTATQDTSGTSADGLPTEQYESLLALLRDLQGHGSTPATTPGVSTQPVPNRPPTKVGVYHPTPLNPNLPVGTGWYKVRKGDTLASIAKRFKIPVSNLFELNTKSALNRLSPGEAVRVRGRAGPKP